MDFSFTEEQQMLQDSVQKFVRDNYDFETRRELLASDRGYSSENWNLFAELGWLTVPFREEDGGFGGSAVDLMVMMEELGRAMVLEPFVPTAVIAGGLISELGTDDQKRELLPRIMGGELQLACAISEPGSRFNLANVATRAEAQGEKVILSGSKVAVLNGSHADQLLVVARSAGSQLERNGISVYLVDAGAPGVKRHGYTNVDGHGAAAIDFDAVEVSSAACLGAPGEAYAALEKVVDRATVAVASEAVGALDSLLQKTVEYSKTRNQFGVPIGTFQALQHRMADMFIECQLARSIVMMAAMKLDSSAGDDEKAKAVSAAKSRLGRAIFKVGQEAIQLHGGIGITDELDVAHLFKRVTAIETLFGNTDYHTRRFASL
ncbi:MAG: acyl-CoA dehydrogenase [Gammaproteobacteria bacterium]|nr:acyl-CoA dehydrogenase family protein [Pseudomonadales bacterium]MCP5345410.1 acyl-CoA dehydrogenase family protein [Pseudomonadales bacterium]